MSKVFFVTTTATAGTELWTTDGTTSSLLKDIIPGVPGSFPHALFSYAGKLYFIANDGVHGDEMWVTDGTSAGTHILKDITSGTGSTNFDYKFLGDGGGTFGAEPTPVGNKVYFFADDPSLGRELWVTDGTTANTTMVKDLGASVYGGYHLTNANGKLFFVAADSGGSGIWTSNGTSGGTVKIAPVVSIESDLFALGSSVLFTAYDPSHGYELWHSNGTLAGTGILKDINTGAGVGGDPTNFTLVGNKYYFDANDPTHGDELWVTDGTATGTHIVKDTNLGPADGFLYYAGTDMTAVGDHLFFKANDGVHGAELWESDGTSTGTHMVKDITPGAAYTYFSSDPMVAAGGNLYFLVRDATHGQELWVSDGSSAGTHLVKDIMPGLPSSQVADMTAVGGLLYFTAYDATSHALWRTDGSTAGTVKVASVAAALDMTPTGNLTAFDGKIFFSATDGAHGEELWSTSGTTAGTALFKDVGPGVFSDGSPVDGMPSQFTVLGSTMYFMAVEGGGLWKTNGTAAGTSLVTTLNNPSFLTAFNGKLYFSQIGPSGGGNTELWTSDGIAGAGHTVMLKDINPGANGSDPSNFTVVGGKMFFTADDGTNGRELWVTNGTATGTHIVQNITPDSVPYIALGNLTAAGTKLFFVDDDGTHGEELWTSDGIAGVGHTAMVKDIRTGDTQQIDVDNLLAVGSKVFFAAIDATHGSELWVSDGSSAGTKIVKDINPGASYSNPIPELALGTNKLIFVDGGDLWVSDGTGPGTTMLKDLPSGSGAGNFIAVGSAVYFTADSDGVHGQELWKTNGTAPGTVMVKDIGGGEQVGFGEGGLGGFAAYNGVLYFTATVGDHTALWKSNGTVAGTVEITSDQFFSQIATFDTPAKPPTNGPDSLTGTIGDDSLNGLGGNDTINGLAGNDTINGGPGVDHLVGGDGTDTYVVDVPTDIVTETNASIATGGNDLVEFVGASGTFTLGANVERLTLGGAAAINGTGNALANTITGNAGANVLLGEAGKDVLIGGLGRDTLAGNTTSTADDAAQDIFKFTSTTQSGVTAATEDVIWGHFTGGTATGDKIDLSAIPTGSSALAFTFVTGPLTGHPGQVNVIGSAGGTYTVQVNTDADATPEMTILVHTAAHIFAATDFVL